MASSGYNQTIQCWCWKCLGRFIDQVAWRRHNGYTRASVAHARDELVYFGWVYVKTRKADPPIKPSKRKGAKK